MEEELKLLKIENEELKSALIKERERCRVLEEECDILAWEIQRAKGDAHSSQRNNVPVVITDGSPIDVIDDCSKVSMTKFYQILDACSGKNVLCVKFSDLDSSLFCGGVDASLSCFRLNDGSSFEKEYFIQQKAPVLSIDIWKHLVLFSMMDGSHALIDSRLGTCAEETMIFRHDHSKYCVRCRFRPDGEMYVTVSHDKTVNIYKKISSQSMEYVKIQSFSFLVTPEDAIFVPLSMNDKEADQDDYELVIALRESSSLLYVNCTTFSQRTVSLNENDWDEHVSFNALALSLSPSGSQLVVSTDKDMHLIVECGSHRRRKLLVGHNCGEYGKPKLAWDSTSSFLLSNSEGDNDIFVFKLATGRIVDRIAGHRGLIKDISVSAGLNMVATASFDHSIIIWKIEILKPMV